MGGEGVIEWADGRTDVVDDGAREGLQLLEVGVRDGRGEALQTRSGLGGAIAEIGWNGSTLRTVS